MTRLSRRRSRNMRDDALGGAPSQRSDCIHEAEFIKKTALLVAENGSASVSRLHP
jgi:hypothetical protein